MPLKSIAVAIDVSAEPGPGTSPPPGWDKGGTWSAAPLTVQTRAFLRINGSPAAWTASTTFSYSGTQGGNGPTVAGPFPLTLNGSSVALMGASTPLLRDGDEVTDSFNNKIVVSAGGPLRSD